LLAPKALYNANMNNGLGVNYHNNNNWMPDGKLEREKESAGKPKKKEEIAIFYTADVILFVLFIKTFLIKLFVLAHSTKR
jgi:hypothetical protein